MKKKICLILCIIFIFSINMGFTAPAKKLTTKQQLNVIMNLSEEMVNNINDLITDYKAYADKKITGFALYQTSSSVETDLITIKKDIKKYDKLITNKQYKVVYNSIKKNVNLTQELVKLCEDTYHDETLYFGDLKDILNQYDKDYNTMSNFYLKELKKQ